jgi:DNA-binding SARP family transcriptional activator
MSLPGATATGAVVELCGSLGVSIGGRRVESALPGPKGRQLLACLVVSRSQPMSRDQLIEVIWPHNPPADPDGAFSTLLTRVRGALGAGVVRGRGELTIDLGPDPWIDWEVAHESVGAGEARLAAGYARAALEAASEGLAIARRRLLPGISTPWLEERRRELVELCAALLEVHGRAALALGDEHLPTAERSARELIEREPYRESAYALLMETQAARGNVAEALRVYDALRRLLREELGLTPAPSVTALAERMLEQEPRPTGALSPAGDRNARAPLPPVLAAAARRRLAGRRGELRRGLEAVLPTSADGARVLAVTGEPGIGKTRLVAEIAARAHAAGGEVLYGRAQRDATTPCQPFVQALRRYLAHDETPARALAPVMGPELGELSRVVPELRTVVGVPAADAPASVRLHRFFDAVGALVGAVARRRPVLVALEDLHLADRWTAALLRHVVLATHGAAVTFVVTFRDDEPLPAPLRSALVDLVSERALERIVLRGLDERETHELLGAGRAADEIRMIHAQAGGNPFFAEELASAQGRLPAAVLDVLQWRLERLPPASRRALAVAAGAGTTFDLATVAQRTQAPRDVVLGALGHAVRSGLVMADPRTPQRFAFRHELVRGALLTATAGSTKAS